jgi:hypothetical protein
MQTSRMELKKIMAGYDAQLVVVRSKCMQLT